jgi:hypothetical protein
MTDDSWITKAQRTIKRQQQTTQRQRTTYPAVNPQDLAAWQRLCVWRATHPRTYLTDGDVPADLRGLLGPAAAATREHWQSLNLLPLYRHPRYGWCLAEDWATRLVKLEDRYLNPLNEATHS